MCLPPPPPPRCIYLLSPIKARHGGEARFSLHPLGGWVTLVLPHTAARARVQHVALGGLDHVPFVGKSNISGESCVPRSRLGAGESRACWLAWEAGHGAASGGEGVRCWQHEAALMMPRALGRREPVDGFGLEFRAAGCLAAPGMLFDGREKWVSGPQFSISEKGGWMGPLQRQF